MNRKVLKEIDKNDIDVLYGEVDDKKELIAKCKKYGIQTYITKKNKKEYLFIKTPIVSASDSIEK